MRGEVAAAVPPASRAALAAAAAHDAHMEAGDGGEPGNPMLAKSQEPGIMNGDIAAADVGEFEAFDKPIGDNAVCPRPTGLEAESVPGTARFTSITLLSMTCGSARHLSAAPGESKVT
mmetsp:Transcript_6927/g.19517  ORF Transcript_6927/g.19517 Transcript_6927/m.19517 type:complete len:118 (-) Transcript_6927:316-669(-)